MSLSPLHRLYPNPEELMGGPDEDLSSYRLGPYYVAYNRAKQVWWLDGSYGEFVEMDNGGGELRIAMDANHSYIPIPWAEVWDEYRAQALLLVCPD